ncbi:MAG: pilus assembly protein, partial [Deltaproteobacteria bacterium]|nr:pilus assembly protein [Deltaproteobacteria bacterium]
MIMRFMVFLLLVALGACAHPGAPSQEQLEQQGEKYHELGKSKAFSVVDAPYLGALAFPLSRDEAALGMQVVMRRRGSLSQLGATIGDMTGLTVSVNAHIPEPISGDKKSGDLPLLEDGFPGREAFSDGKPFSVSYEGALRGLLDNIAVLTGYGWDFDAKTNTIVFARLIARTF